MRVPVDILMLAGSQVAIGLALALLTGLRERAPLERVPLWARLTATWGFALAISGFTEGLVWILSLDFGDGAPIGSAFRLLLLTVGVVLPLIYALWRTRVALRDHRRN
jgi:hypothetical protein